MSIKDLLFSSQGRIPRSTWWYYTLAVGGISLGYTFLSYMLAGSDAANVLNCLYALFSLALLYPGLMVNIKRCHDRNRSGWFLLWSYIPSFIFLGVYIILIISWGNIYNIPDDSWSYLFMFMCVCYITPLWVFIELGFLKGTAGPNKYGPNPLEAGPSYSAAPGQIYSPPSEQPGIERPVGSLPIAPLPSDRIRECFYCGEPIDKGSAFCKYCGKEQPR